LANTCIMIHAPRVERVLDDLAHERRRRRASNALNR
jgi:hypothetical protein